MRDAARLSIRIVIWLQFNFRGPDFLQIIAIILAQAVSPLSRSDLRWEFLNIAAAVALLSTALVAIALFFFRRAQEDDITLLVLDFQAAGSRIQ
jgi:hypothetical protein